MQGMFVIVFASLIAFGLMAMLMLSIEATGWVKTRHFWDIGAVMAGGQSRKRARFLTLASHASLAIVFGFIYVTIWSSFDLTDPALYGYLGLMTGIVHGLAASAALIMLVSNDKEGLKVATSQVLTHAVFGLVVGTTIALLEPRYEPVATIARLIQRQFFYS